jgi:hypothetical protein
VEIVRNSDVMLEVGGVGCLLRYLTSEQRARLPSPVRGIGQEGHDWVALK